MKVDTYEIKSYTKFSWGYVCHIAGKRIEIWADDVKSLKRKVLARGLPWDDEKVPEPEPVRITTHYIEVEGSPAQFRLPWCKSNYKRY